MRTNELKVGQYYRPTQNYLNGPSIMTEFRQAWSDGKKHKLLQREDSRVWFEGVKGFYDRFGDQPDGYWNCLSTEWEQDDYGNVWIPSKKVKKATIDPNSKVPPSWSLKRVALRKISVL